MGLVITVIPEIKSETDHHISKTETWRVEVKYFKVKAEEMQLQLKEKNKIPGE